MCYSSTSDPIFSFDFSISTYNFLRITKSSISRSTIWAYIIQVMTFGCVVSCSAIQIVQDEIDQNQVITFRRMLPDWFVPNESYTVLFFQRVILYLLSLCPLPLMQIDPLDVAGPSLLVGYCYDKVLRYTEMNQGLYQPSRETENTNDENRFATHRSAGIERKGTLFKCLIVLALEN